MDETVLLRYLDGELDEATAAAVAEQLRRDPALRRRIAQLRAIEAAYQSPRDEALADDRRGLLLQRLRSAPAQPHYDLLRRDDLEALAEVRSERWPVVSLYLDLDPERRMAEDPVTRSKALARQAEQRVRLGEPPAFDRATIEEELGHVRDWLVAEQPLRGRGLALLSCSEIGLWRAFRLSVPVNDRLEIADRPYLRPLLTLIDEFERYLVVLAGSGTARLLEVFLGVAEEVTDLVGYVPPATGQFVEKTGHRHDAYLHLHVKTIMEQAEALWRDRRFEWLVIGGTEEALGELRRHVPKIMQERLAGELRLSPQVEVEHLLDRVLEIERAHEQRIEAERVEQLVTMAHKGGAAVLGLDASLLAVVEGRVYQLILAEGYRHAGWECSNCAFMSVHDQPVCPLCGSALIPQRDIVEVAIGQVLDQAGTIEVVRSRPALEQLMLYGGIGALLRYAYPSPEE